MTRPVLLVAVIVLAVVMAALYVSSVNAYRASLDATFVPPDTQPDGVAVVLIPFDVDALAQSVPTEVVIFPGSNLLSPEGRLKRTISLDTNGKVSGTVTFERGSVPSPVRVDMPAIGVVQRYPFDSYRYDVPVRSVVERSNRSTLVPNPIPLSLSVFFKVPGWSNTPIQAGRPFSSDELSVSGTISRAGSTITVVLIFVALMVMFAVLAVMAVVAGWRGRIDPGISTAAWLTGAVFALITLRNNLPGHPPLGSWMDILFYYWVIVVIMLMIGVTVVTLVTGSKQDDDAPGTTPSQ